jgi:hypothetical protein
MLVIYTEKAAQLQSTFHLRTVNVILIATTTMQRLLTPGIQQIPACVHTVGTQPALPPVPAPTAAPGPAATESVVASGVGDARKTASLTKPMVSNPCMHHHVSSSTGFVEAVVRSIQICDSRLHRCIHGLKFLAVIRMRNVLTSSYEIKLQNPRGNDSESVGNREVHCRRCRKILDDARWRLVLDNRCSVWPQLEEITGF